MSVDQQKQALPECHGISFTFTDDTCMKVCEVRDGCIKKIASKYLPELEGKAGKPLRSVDLLVGPLDTDPVTAGVVLLVAGGSPVTKALTDAMKPPSPPPAKKEKAPPKAAHVPEGADEDPRQVTLDEAIAHAAEKGSDPPPSQVSSFTIPQPDAVAVVTAPTKAAVKPPKAGPKKVEKKSLGAKKKIKPVVAATVAAAKKTAKAAVAKASSTPKGKALLKKKVKGVPPPAAPSAEVAVPDNAYREVVAYQREFGRSAYVQSLKDKATLRRSWEGKEYVLTVDREKQRYVMNGKSYPTLYLAMSYLTGHHEYAGGKKHSAWSLKRFWGNPE